MQEVISTAIPIIRRKNNQLEETENLDDRLKRAQKGPRAVP